MNKKSKTLIIIALCLLTAFALFTVLVSTVDVEPIGEGGTLVGFASLNRYVHSLFGVNMQLYFVTDLLGLVPIVTCIGFAILGLAQWIKRKSILMVDRDIITLGIFYLAVIMFFLFFENVVVNYRPILIEGRLEASYPSSTTLLVLCVMPTAAIELRDRIRRAWLRKFTFIFIVSFILFTVVGRLISGVHWFTDITGGVLLSAGLVLLYDGIYRMVR